MSAKSSVAKPDSSEARLETLCKKYRIEFAGEIPSADWPDRHRKTLANARQVSEYTYEAYATEPHVTENNPWKIEVKQQAITLTEVVKRCQYRNESSWRHACEPIILGRLSAEVCWYWSPTSSLAEAEELLWLTLITVENAESVDGDPKLK